MKTLPEYLIPEPEEYQPQVIILLSGELDPLAELRVAVTVACAAKWRAVLLLDANEQPLGVVATDDLETDMQDEAAQRRQRGILATEPVYIPLPIIYVCSKYAADHPRYISVRRGHVPQCKACGRYCVELQSQR